MTTKKDDLILSSGALQREEIRIGMSAAAIRQEILDNLTYRVFTPGRLTERQVFCCGLQGPRRMFEKFIRNAEYP